MRTKNWHLYIYTHQSGTKISLYFCSLASNFYIPYGLLRLLICGAFQVSDQHDFSQGD